MKRSKTKLGLNFRRFEFKYLMPAKLADIIVASIVHYTNIDPYIEKEDFYYVNSIYLDSNDFFFYQEKLSGLKNRKKYRLRFYGEEIYPPKQPLFFEIKRRVDAVIIKNRTVVRLKHLRAINLSNWQDVAQENQKFFTEFYHDYRWFGLKPGLFVRYKRKPFFSKFDRNFRVTFDFDLQAAKVNQLTPGVVHYRNILNKVAVMEVKFNGIIPSWFAEVIRTNNLKRAPFSKYCNSLNIIYNFDDELPIIY